MTRGINKTEKREEKRRQHVQRVQCELRHGSPVLDLTTFRWTWGLFEWLWWNPDVMCWSHCIIHGCVFAVKCECAVYRGSLSVGVKETTCAWGLCVWECLCIVQQRLCRIFTSITDGGTLEKDLCVCTILCVIIFPVYSYAPVQTLTTDSLGDLGINNLFTASP